MFEKELELAIRAAKTGGALLRRRENIHVNSDAGKDLKLSSDRESEAAILSLLRSETSYPILTEERGLLNGEDDNGLQWIVDPLDGTVNYFRGLTDLCCISIALWRGNEPILGVVYRFETDELFTGICGEGAFHNGEPIRVSGAERMETSILATGFPSYRDYGTESLLSFVRQVQRFKKIRMLGAAAIMGTCVASGWVDAYCEEHIMIWDIAAAASLVKAAGGVAKIELLENGACNCGLFASQALMEEFHAESV